MVLQASAGLYLILVPTDHYLNRDFLQVTHLMCCVSLRPTALSAELPPHKLARGRGFEPMTIGLLQHTSIDPARQCSIWTSNFNLSELPACRGCVYRFATRA